MPLIFSTFRGINPAIVGDEVRRAVADGINGFFVEFGELDAKPYPVFGEFILASVAASAPTILIAHYDNPVRDRIAAAVACGADIISTSEIASSENFHDTVSSFGALSCFYAENAVELENVDVDMLLFASNALKQQKLSSQMAVGLRESSPHLGVQEGGPQIQFFVGDYFLHSEAVRRFSKQYGPPPPLITSPLAKAYPDGLHIRRDDLLKKQIFESIGAAEPPSRLTAKPTSR